MSEDTKGSTGGHSGGSERPTAVELFDDERVVVNAGIVLAVTLGQRLGLERLVDQTVRLGGRAGASRPGSWSILPVQDEQSPSASSSDR